MNEGLKKIKFLLSLMKGTLVDVNQTEETIEKRKPSLYLRIIQIVACVFVFFLSIHLLSLAFTSLNQNIINSIIDATANPFVGLFIGLLITAMIQSSSTSTSIIVAIVASGTLSIQNAIPLVMGANIGTTITSTLVSLGFITKKKEFRRAIAAGTLHDFFNILTVFVMFPLEYQFGILSHSAEAISSGISFLKSPSSGGSFLFVDYSFIGKINTSIMEWINNVLVVIVIALILIFTTIKLISSLMYKSLIGETKDQINSFIFRTKGSAFSWGAIFTVAVQSSSITTPLVVPLVATGRVSLTKAFPFIIGANIGTTITALLAALFKSDAALTIAIVHLLFNMAGVIIFFPLKGLRKVPIFLASRLGALTKRYRLVGFVYIIFTFFLIPFTLIYFNQEDSEPVQTLPPTEIQITEHQN